MISQATSFPQITVSDKDKNKDYHQRWVSSIVTNTFNDSWNTSYNVLKSLYSFFLDGTGQDLTGYLQTAPDGSQMPGIWVSLNNSHTRLKVLMGELEERGYEIKVRPLSNEAFDRKREEKERLRAKRYLQEIVAYAEQLAGGIPLESPEYVPQSEEELDEFMDLTWKDKFAVILQYALKWIAETKEWDEKRKALFRDILIVNRAILVNEIINGVPTPRRVDPLRFIFDPNSTDDYLSDSTYFGEVDYIPLAQAAERYNVSVKELEEAYNSYEGYLGLGADLRNGHSDHSFFNVMPGQTLRWFKIQDGTPRCLVFKGCWRDYKYLNHKYEKKEKEGGEAEYLQDVTDKPYSKKDEIITNRIECWRQGTLVGGKFLVEWGECPNQPRSLENLHKAEAPYQVWIPDFLLGRSTSMQERIMTLQLQKDIAAYQIQIQVARAIGKVLIMDEAFLPEGMTRDNAMSYIKADGMAWINSKEYQLNVGGTNYIKDVDVSLSESIGQCLTLIQYYDQQMDSITGVSEARQGVVQGSSQAVGVTNVALFQSNLVTAPLFKGFERFCSRSLNYQAKLVKIAWAGKEVFAPIIGSAGIDFLKEHIDISLEEFDVIVKSLPPVTLERQKLDAMVEVAMQSGLIEPDDALDILIEQDTTVAVRKFKRIYRLKKIYRDQQEQQQAEAEQMAQQQMSQQQIAAMMAGYQNQLQLQQMKNKGNLQKTMVTGKVKLNSEKLRGLMR